METLSLKQQIVQLIERIDALKKRFEELDAVQKEIVAEIKRVNNKLKTLEK